MKRIMLVMLVCGVTTFTTQAQIVHNDNVEIEKSDGAKLDMTHTGNNKTWRMISGLYGGFQIGYLTGGLTGNTAPFIIKENGYIGMLMTSPNNILDPLTVNGNIGIFDANAGIKLGGKAFISAPGSNTFLGVDAGINIGTGTKNVFVGNSAGKNNDTGSENLFLGNSAGEVNVGGNYNTFIGRLAGGNNLNGHRNLFLGRQSGFLNDNGSDNIYMGYSAGRSNKGNQNVFLGSEAGFASTLSANNVFIGFNSGRNVNNTTGRNTYIGTQSGSGSTTGSNNVAIGYESGKALMGEKNVAIGVGAGSGGSASGNSNVYLGYEAGVGAESYSDRLYIANKKNSDRTPLIYGEFDNGKVGINTTNLEATSALTVGGKIAATEYLLDDGSPLLGSIFTPWTANASDITFATGKVGIGTTGPVANLDVRGNGNVAQFGNSVYEDQYVSIRDVTNGGMLGIAPTNDGGVFQLQAGNNKGMRFRVGGASSGSAWSTGINAIEITKNGKVGINTTNLEATSALTVGGKIAATEYLLDDGSPLLGSIFTPWMANASDITFQTGDVGIGTATPSAKLHVNGDIYVPLNKSMGYSPGGDTFTYGGDNVGHYTLGWYSVPGSAEARLSGYGGIKLFTASTPRMSISDQGDVGIGTVTPGAKLHVAGTGTGIGTVVSSIMIGKTNGPQIQAIQESTDNDVQALAFRVKSSNLQADDSFEAMRLDKNGDLGIGITSPGSKFHVKDGSQEIRLLTGTNTSGYKLDIGVNDDGVNFSNTSTWKGFNFNNSNGRLVTILPNGNVEGPDGESILSGFKNIRGRSTDGILHLRGGTTSGTVFVNHYETGDVIMANGGGDVGIGTASPTAKLDVNGNAVFHGKIESTKVRVSTTPQGGWPDYVFEPEFRLRPLSEVEAFVNENKHLPEVPSAKEVEANGIDLGNMDATLLKKVEELTLYMIEMNKKIEKLEEENKQLKELVKKDK